ncbi:MAG: tyrosine-type recombinase/integrase [Solirubrobacteraceae bacterium]
MDLRRTYNGKWELRWQESGHKRSRTFDRKSDAQDFDAWPRRRRQLGKAAVPDDVKLCEFVETYWQLHAVPNLSEATRALYGRIWDLHILPRLGEYGVREITPKRLVRFRADLENAKLGAATIVKAMTIVQSILSFAVSEELVEYNAAAGVPKPRYTRAREPHVDTKRRKLRFTPLLKPRRRSQGVVARVRPPDRPAAGVPRPRRRLLGPGRLAQLAPANMAGRTGAPARGPPQPDLREARVCTQRYAAPGPPLELCDAACLRGRSAHADRPGGRHERPDDRAALRRRDRQLGRKTGPRRAVHPRRAQD